MTVIQLRSVVRRNMMNRISQAAGLVLIAVLVSAGSEAGAAVILAGNSNTSSFSNCVGTACGSNTGTSLPLSSFTLNIDPISFSATGNTTGLALAELDLIAGNNPSGSATFNYSLVLNFTTPSGVASDTFNLAMSAMGTGTNSTETLSPFTLSLADPLVLPGVTLSNFHFVNTNNGTSGDFSSGVWTVTRGPGMPGSTSSTLDLVADVTAAAAVPEPSSFTVLGVALPVWGLSGGVDLLSAPKRAGIPVEDIGVPVPG